MFPHNQFIFIELALVAIDRHPLSPTSRSQFVDIGPFSVDAEVFQFLSGGELFPARPQLRSEIRRVELILLVLALGTKP